ARPPDWTPTTNDDVAVTKCCNSCSDIPRLMEKEVDNHEHERRYSQKPCQYVFAHCVSPMTITNRYDAPLGLGWLSAQRRFQRRRGGPQIPKFGVALFLTPVGAFPGFSKPSH